MANPDLGHQLTDQQLSALESCDSYLQSMVVVGRAQAWQENVTVYYTPLYLEVE